VAKIPDAVKIPQNWAYGDSSVERNESLVVAVEPMLGVDRSIGERAWGVAHGDGMVFFRKNYHESMFFPHGHKLEGHPRYNWVVQPDETVFGYLVAAAQPKNPVTSEVASAE
jgi:hypothetical protein